MTGAGGRARRRVGMRPASDAATSGPITHRWSETAGLDQRAWLFHAPVDWIGHFVAASRTHRLSAAG